MAWFYMLLRDNPYGADAQSAWYGDYMGDREAKRAAKAFAKQFPGGAVDEASGKPRGALDLTPYAPGSVEADAMIDTLSRKNDRMARELGIRDAPGQIA